MKFLNVILIVYSLLITNVFGATITDDTLKIGKPGSSANKEITLGTNQKIRSNQTTGALEFTNDGGALYKKLGSGSGSGGSSGVNLITNDSFEDGIGSPWTSSGGTFSQQTYTVGAEDDTKYARFIATTSGQYVEQIVSVKTNLGVGCQADFKKVNIATAGIFKVQALDVSNNPLAEQVIGVSSWIKVPTISFPCPAAGVNVLKLRLISLAAGTIDFDKAYIGSNQNLVSVSQAHLFGSLVYQAATNCLWTVTSATFVNFPADTDCSTPVASGKISAPATKVPGFSIPNAPAGTYFIVVNGFFSRTGGTGQSMFRLSDGANNSESQAVYSGAGSMGSPVITGKINYTTAQNNLSIQIQSLSPSGSSAIEADTPVSSEDLSFSVYYYPLSSETAVSNEQSSWFIDANIGGQNPNLGIGAVTSYSEIPGTTLDLVVNASKGSAAAEIACASGSPSTGLTCTGPESIGIAFIPPMAGVYEACFSFSHETQTSSSAQTTFQIVETSNTSSAIVSEGNERIPSGTQSAINVVHPLKVCGRFVFSDTSKKTLRLMYEQGGSGIAVSNVQASRDATVGQKDLSITVFPINSSYPRPTLYSQNPVAFSSGTATSITATSTPAVLTFGTPIVDTFSGWNSGTNTWTVPAGQGGIYEIDASTNSSVPVNAVYATALDIQKNGSAIATGGVPNQYTTSAMSLFHSVKTTVTLSPGDVIRVMFSQNSGTNGSANIDPTRSRFSIKKVNGY